MMGSMSKERPTVVGDIMSTKVVTLLPEQNLLGVAEALQHFEYRHVPVVDDGKVVGVITRVDVLNTAASAFEADSEFRTSNIESFLFVSEVMSTEVRTVRPDTPLAKAAEAMRFYKIGCLPVVDDDELLVGIVTTTDFLTLSIHLLESRDAES